MPRVSYEKAMRLDQIPGHARPPGMPTPRQTRDHCLGLAQVVGYADILRPVLESKVQYNVAQLARWEMLLSDLIELQVSRLIVDEVSTDGD